MEATLRAMPESFRKAVSDEEATTDVTKKLDYALLALTIACDMPEPRPELHHVVVEDRRIRFQELSLARAKQRDRPVIRYEDIKKLWKTRDDFLADLGLSRDAATQTEGSSRAASVSTQTARPLRDMLEARPAAEMITDEPARRADARPKRTDEPRRPPAPQRKKFKVPAKTTPQQKEEEELPERLKHCDAALVKRIENEIMEKGETVTFDDVAGLDGAKAAITEMVIWPMRRPELFTGLRAVPKGMLLFGPPGTGKTMIGRAIASSCEATFFSISASSLMSKWIGESEKLVRALFAVAGYKEPSVVFVDEVDSMLSQRSSDENEASRRLKTEFLVQLEGVDTSKSDERVLVVGATNRPQELDEAARRRFVKRFYVPLPDDRARGVLLRRLLAKNDNRLDGADIDVLVQSTSGFSGADVRNLCQEAAMGPMRDVGARLFAGANDVQIPPIVRRHFDDALRITRATVAPSDLAFYEDWDRNFGTGRGQPLNKRQK